MRTCGAGREKDEAPERAPPGGSFGYPGQSIARRISPPLRIGGGRVELASGKAGEFVAPHLVCVRFQTML
jgi:hypothetical protein